MLGSLCLQSIPRSSPPVVWSIIWKWQMYLVLIDLNHFAGSRTIKSSSRLINLLYITNIFKLKLLASFCLELDNQVLLSSDHLFHVPHLVREWFLCPIFILILLIRILTASNLKFPKTGYWWFAYIANQFGSNWLESLRLELDNQILLSSNHLFHVPHLVREWFLCPIFILILLIRILTASNIKFPNKVYYWLRFPSSNISSARMWYGLPSKTFLFK